MNNKGQNMIEYILLFAAVVAVLLVILGPGGFFSKAVQNSMDTSVDGLVTMANDVYQGALRSQPAP